MNIEIKKEDIAPYVYFVCSMAHESENEQSAMYGSLGGKSDFIGGIFDRWINIIPESLIFNKLLLQKAKEEAKTKRDVRVYSDFFKYDPKKVGIAPDVFGLLIDNKIVPFIKYDDRKEEKNYWVPQDDCPQIEVKSFKGKQYMVSLRDQHYEDKYLVLVAMNLSVDYLLPFFNPNFISKDSINKLKMPNDFIISNEKELLGKTENVVFEKDTLGTLNLLRITTANMFKSVALKLEAGEIPRFFRSVEERKTLIKNEKFKIKSTLDTYCEKQECGLYRFKANWYDLFNKDKEKTLDIQIEKGHNLMIINNTNNAITVLALENAKINGFSLEKGKQYNIVFGTFGGVAGKEYFINKCCIDFLPNKEQSLINELAKVIKTN